MNRANYSIFFVQYCNKNMFYCFFILRYILMELTRIQEKTTTLFVPLLHSALYLASLFFTTIHTGIVNMIEHHYVMYLSIVSPLPSRGNRCGTLILVMAYDIYNTMTDEYGHKNIGFRKMGHFRKTLSAICCQIVRLLYHHQLSPNICLKLGS